MRNTIPTMIGSNIDISFAFFLGESDTKPCIIAYQDLFYFSNTCTVSSFTTTRINHLDPCYNRSHVKPLSFSYLMPQYLYLRLSLAKISCTMTIPRSHDPTIPRSHVSYHTPGDSFSSIPDFFPDHSCCFVCFDAIHRMALISMSFLSAPHFAVSSLCTFSISTRWTHLPPSKPLSWSPG